MEETSVYLNQCRIQDSLGGGTNHIKRKNTYVSVKPNFSQDIFGLWGTVGTTAPFTTALICITSPKHKTGSLSKSSEFFQDETKLLGL